MEQPVVRLLISPMVFQSPPFGGYGLTPSTPIVHITYGFSNHLFWREQPERPYCISPIGFQHPHIGGYVVSGYSSPPISRGILLLISGPTNTFAMRLLAFRERPPVWGVRAPSSRYAIGLLVFRRTTRMGGPAPHPGPHFFGGITEAFGGVCTPQRRGIFPPK